MDYRREIDGLRALAVLPVILFHAGFQTFSGGFVGVDVFFVISGYLITSIILSEKQAGTFRLINFYERRARRILPALFVVMFTCLPFAWLWLLPNAMKDFSKSLVAVSSLASNILFWREIGYFDIKAELKPLLHTWSLAVEEQYYLFFPIFLMLAWRLGKRWIVSLLVVVAVISLVTAQWASVNKPAAAFYLLPTRSWELLIGAFIAFYFSNQYKIDHRLSVSQTFSVIGLLLIVYSIFVFDKNTPFPSVYTLIPTIGAGLIILFATQQTFVGKLLGGNLFVGVGLMSYSTYLWHQPLFAFARYKNLGEPSKLLMIALAVAAVVLAYFSWRYVEMPFRKQQRFNRKQIFLYGSIGSAFFIAVGLAGHLNDGFKSRLPPNLVWESIGAKVNTNGDICETKAIEGYAGVLTCEFGDRSSQKAILLYGDSHSQAISEELHKRLISLKLKGVKIGLDGCSVVPQIYDTRYLKKLNDCEKKFKNMLSYIKASSSEIIVASRWTFRLYPIPGEIDQMPYMNSEGGRETDTEYKEFVAVLNGKPSFESAEKRRALSFLVEGILSTGVKAYFIYPVPEIAWDIAKVNMNYYSKNSSVLAEISIPYNDFYLRNKFVHETFKAFEANNNFVPIKPELIFCNSFVKGRCVAQFDSIPFYYDDDHLSDAGARLVVDEISKHLDK